jgi:S-adenosylmethionine hydrolase
VVGVDAGATFAFLAELTTEVRVLECATRGSQFRSRDLFPDALARVVRGDAGVFGPIVPAAALPTVPQGRVAYVDGFGNLKTTWRWGALPAGLEPGAPATVSIGDRTAPARVAGGAFAVPEGTIAVAPGSSGYVGRDGRGVRWVEVFLRGGDAAAAFGAVRPGDPVALTPS